MEGAGAGTVEERGGTTVVGGAALVVAGACVVVAAVVGVATVLEHPARIRLARIRVKIGKRNHFLFTFFNKA